jgi:hypothetical protein
VLHVMMVGVRRFLVLCAVGAILLATQAGNTAPRAWVRGPVAQAGMIATVIGHGSHPIQVLTRRCANVRDETGCARISRSLRHAIEDAVDAPIVWVHRMWRHAGTYWVFSPFAWNGDHARLRYAWRYPTPGDCFGGGKGTFTLTGGAWEKSGGSGYFGCS